jgi:glycosyltransferase involved in cell wall biosynthesis
LKVLILIPAYNEEGYIGKLLDILLHFFRKGDILVVDDGSTDATSLEARERGVNVITLDENRGKGFALKRGFHFALQKNYDAVITMDADLQHNPHEIKKFLKKAEEGYDIIVGSRFGEFANMPPDRYLSNRLTTLVLSLVSRRKLVDTQSGFRFIRRNVLEKVKLKTNRYQTESELLFKAARSGFRITNVPIKTLYMGERSSINRLLDTLRFIKLVICSLWH